MIEVFVRMRRDERGVAMMIAVALSFVVAMLAALMFGVATHTDKATARGRHFTQALHVAESGIEHAIARIEQADGALASTTFSGETELGDYDVSVTRLPRNRYTITSTGGVRRGRELGAERTIQVSLEPPLSFEKALFSYTTVETKNNDVIDGDVWGNHNVILASGTQVYGSVVAAAGYVDLGSGSIVDGDVISGGFNPSPAFAIRLGTNAQVGGDATASVVSVACVGADNADYKVLLNTGSVIGGNVTTFGTINNSGGVVGGSSAQNICTQAEPTDELPAYTFHEENYGSVTYFGTPSLASATAVTQFQTYLAAVGGQLSGAFYINQADPVNQGIRVDLSNAVITGDTTIITNTPIFTNNTTDNGTDVIFTLISTYDPPAATSCDVNYDLSECSVHLKNNFSTSGTTAVLVYSPYGSVAIKNNAEMFGAIFADSIQVKNNQTMTYDDRVGRVVGFGEVTLEITEWQEIPS
jgi:hypothetical protein